MASVPTSRDRSCTSPLIASEERSTSAPDLTNSPATGRSRAASQQSSHGELLRQAINLKQERNEIEEQMRKIEERLRVHEDVLFTDERQTLRARQSRLKASYESKQAMLADLQACLLYTSDAADEEDSVDLGGRNNIQENEQNTIKGDDDTSQTNQKNNEGYDLS
eukprot:TRINITY_DN16665_c0_g1_i2.p1 TRINITY_DN16665_c0_g1~~TRINITY_DN16665_c0_g1_i2.p1  ORF type:complete len:165 (+),score=23.42 TRINITY_DN16665_c0_g1_i2:32-526(+)